MKKLAFFAIIALVLISCSKEQRTSRKLDGTWKLTKFNGEGVPEGLIETFTFSKDKKGKGDGTYKYSYGNFNQNIALQYVVVKENLNITYDGGSESYTILTLEKGLLEIKDEDGEIATYEEQ